MSVSKIAPRIGQALLASARHALCLSSFRFYCQLLFTALLFVNARSFPLVWHFRILRHLVTRSIRSRILLTPRLAANESTQAEQNPFKTLSVFKGWAGPDDCDFLFHLSNSSYAKNLDLARAAICTTQLSSFLDEGGWTPLAGANYQFVSEIPMFSRYEIRSRVGSWDDKWIYLLSEFVTTPGGPVSKKEIAPVDTMGVNPLPQYKRGSVRSDGTVLHCLAVSVYCFKLGRITVPPRVALSLCGFGDQSKDRAHISLLRKEGKLRHFLEAGWRDDGGCELPEFETRRLGRLEWCQKMTEGITEAIGALE